MKHFPLEQNEKHRMTFRVMSIPFKALSTCIILTLTFGMLGALGQVVIHDIIPTFYASAAPDEMSMSAVVRTRRTARMGCDPCALAP